MATHRTSSARRAALVGAAIGLAALAAASSRPATAQNGPGAAPSYQEAVSARRIDREIRYADPGEALDLERAPPPPVETDWELSDTLTTILFGVLLAFLIAVLIRFGGGAFGAFGAKPTEIRRAARHADPDAPEVDPAVAAAAARSLEELRAMADRRLALSALLLRALSAAAEAHDMRLGRSQTARDVLRAVPRAWPHYGALTRLVRTAETVLFGGRAMSDPEFDGCLDLARAILTSPRAGAPA